VVAAPILSSGGGGLPARTTFQGEVAVKLTVCVLVGLALLASVSLVRADDKREKKVPAVLNHTMKGIDGKDVYLSKYQGKVVLFVNVASKCGYTPQYEGLQKVYEKYQKDGFVVIGVPANEFGRQEPGTNEEIAAFCKKDYGVTFPMLAKVVVKGKDQVELYKQLTSKETNPNFGGDVKWNFTKFLIGKNGEVVGRFESDVAPESEKVTKAIEAELAKK
jgi:glutathione peroxidase